MTTILTSDEYQAFVRKNETWNFMANVLDLTFYNLAISFIFGSTILSLYASRLTTSALLIGLIPAIQNVGYFLPQLLMARQTEQLSQMKPFVLKISVMERTPYLVVALGIFLWPGAPHWLSYAILALGLGVATFSGGIAGPAWNAMLAKVIRPERRGRLFGLSQATGGLLGIGGAALSRYALGNYAYPISFGICFLLCFVAQALSWLSLALNHEPRQLPTREVLSLKEYWLRLPQVLRGNPNFARYLLSRALLILGGMGTAFYVLYARHAFQVSDAFAANLTVAALASQTVFTPLLGWLGDKWGHKRLTQVAAAIAGGAVLMALLAPSAPWFYGVFVLLNAGSSGMMVAGLSMTMEFSKTEELPTFVALANTLLAAPMLVAPVLGGWLVDTAGYRALFIVALSFLCLGWGSMRWFVHEPRYARNAGQA
jgi:MFS family permease